MRTRENDLYYLIHKCMCMNDWEVDFIEDITHQYEKRRTLTARQWEKISQIYDDRFIP